MPRVRTGLRGAAVAAAALAGCTLVAPLDGLTGDAASSPGDDDGSVDAAADGSGVDSDSEASVAADAEAGIVDTGTGDHDASDARADAGPSYSTVVMADSPLAYWRVDEATGTVAHDVSGHGNDAQFVGTVSLGTKGALLGDPDTAVTLDGVSGHIDAGNRFAFLATAPMTLEIWARPTTLTATYARLFAREIAGVPREGYLVFVRSASPDPVTFSLERWLDGGSNQCPTQAAVALATWHHFVATYDGTTSRIYLDGQAMNAQPAPLPIPSISASFLVGTSIYDHSFLAGDVDEIAVYGAALSQARITAHYHASGR